MLRFIHLSDTHLGPTGNYQSYQKNTLEYTKALIHHLNEKLPFTPDFVLHTGDVIDDRSDESMQLAAQTFAALKYPIYYVVGNHDSPAALRQYLLKQPRSEDRFFYDFTQQDFHFMVLDSCGQPDPQGYISTDQLAWLEQKCAASTAKSLVIVTHHLPLITDVPWLQTQMRIMNADVLFEVLRPHRERIRGLFFGHIHRALVGFRDGIMCSSAASSFQQFHVYPYEERPAFDNGTLPGFSVVTMTHSETIINYQTVPNL